MYITLAIFAIFCATTNAIYNDTSSSYNETTDTPFVIRLMYKYPFLSSLTLILIAIGCSIAALALIIVYVGTCCIMVCRYMLKKCGCIQKKIPPYV